MICFSGRYVDISEGGRGELLFRGIFGAYLAGRERSAAHRRMVRNKFDGVRWLVVYRPTTSRVVR